jgi:hypothetical protein
LVVLGPIAAASARMRMMIAQPFAGDEFLEQGAIQATRRVQVDVLDDGGLAQLGLAQPARQALVLAAGRLAVDQEAVPVFPSQLGGVGRVVQLDEGFGHGRQAERAQPLDRGMDEHLLSFRGQW